MVRSTWVRFAAKSYLRLLGNATDRMIVFFDAASMFIRHHIVLFIVCLAVDRLISCLCGRCSWYLGLGNTQLETEHQRRCWICDVMNCKQLLTQLMTFGTAVVLGTAARLTACIEYQSISAVTQSVSSSVSQSINQSIKQWSSARYLPQVKCSLQHEIRMVRYSWV